MQTAIRWLLLIGCFLTAIAFALPKRDFVFSDATADVGLSDAARGAKSKT